MPYSIRFFFASSTKGLAMSRKNVQGWVSLQSRRTKLRSKRLMVMASVKVEMATYMFKKTAQSRLGLVIGTA